MPTRLTKEEVNKRLEKYDVVLVSEYTHQYDKTALLQCKCGATFNACVRQAMTGKKRRCENCELQQVKQQLASFKISIQKDPPLNAIFTTKVPMFCFCGNTFESVIPLALNRKIKGCGCAAKSAWDQKNVAGLKINKLTVLSNTAVKNNKNQYSYQCLCDCGAQVVVLCQKILKGDAFGCSQCSKVNAARTRTIRKLKTETQFPHVEVIDTSDLLVKNSSIYVKCRCKNCSAIDTFNYRELRRGTCSPCKKCNNRGDYEKSANIQKRLDQYGLTLLSLYTRNIRPIRVRCKCGEEYETTYVNISHGRNTTCLKCEYLLFKNRLAKYGTVITTEQDQYKGGNSLCDFICFCGKRFTSPLYKPLNKFYQGSCGCATRIQTVDLAGTKFNNLTVLSNKLIRKRGINFLKCRCDCGKGVLVPHHNIKSQRNKMCGTCSALNSTKGIRDRNARELSDYLSQYGYTQLSPYRGTLRKIEVRCCCGKTLKMWGKYFLRLARQNARLNCKCNKIKNGRMTSNPVFKLHDLLERGVHNYNSKAGCIDIALCYKGKKVAIEYDEWWWHKDHKAKDDRKNKKLLDHGWFVLRLRVSGYLPTYQEMIHSLDKLVKSKTRFLARTHKSWRGYIKED